MNEDEIRELLQALSKKAEEEGKSERVRISLKKDKDRRRRSSSGKSASTEPDGKSTTEETPAPAEGRSGKKPSSGEPASGKAAAGHARTDREGSEEEIPEDATRLATDEQIEGRSSAREEDGENVLTSIGNSLRSLVSLPGRLLAGHTPRPKKTAGSEHQANPEETGHVPAADGDELVAEAGAGRRTRKAGVEAAHFESDAEVFRQPMADEPLFGGLFAGLMAGKTGSDRKAKAGKTKSAGDGADAANVGEMTAGEAEDEAGMSIGDGMPEEEDAAAVAGADTDTVEETGNGEDEDAAAEEQAGESMPDEEDVPAPARENEAPEDDADLSGDEGAAAPAGEEKAPAPSVKERLQDWFGSLENRGVGRKELLLIGIGALLVLMILFVLISYMSHRHKMRNVTADEGLTVTVEKEPSSWCTEADVTLGLITNEPIQSVSVNGETLDCDGGTRARVSFTADTEVLDVMVVCDTQVLTAEVEIPYIDSEEPTIGLTSEDGRVAIEAEDERSGLDSIWYGEVRDFNDVPAYREYTEPFVPESDTLYAYFAKDKAGNISTPAVSDLQPAAAIYINATSVSIFPGETYSLDLRSEPDNAYLNGLTVSSSNEDVAVVSEQGVITAVNQGEADITVSALDVGSVSCHVTVRSEASITISSVGDVTLGEDISASVTSSFSTLAALYGTSYFFENVRDILSADDITFANLEGALTSGGTRQNKTFAFRGDPSYTDILLDGSIEVVTLANNHSGDYGDEGLEDTKTNLEEAGIDWCEGDTIVMRDVDGVKVALIGIYVLNEGLAKDEQLQTDIARARREGAQIVVVAFHWGTELATTPDSMQTTLGHAAIDYGADLVVGHHPHVLQGIELYEGKYIAYSLGNFCFGGNTSPSDMDTMILQVTFMVDGSDEITDMELNIVPCRISSSETSNNYQPTPAEGEEAQRILEKISALSEALGTTLDLGV